MKIKLYIVTYNNPEYLDKNLESLFETDIVDYDYEVTVINNHSNFKIRDNFFEDYNLKVINNETRPDWSTGHLARSWNQCLINGFKDLENPDCDVLVHAQDDLTWSKKWVSFILGAHKKYTFITFGTGDGICSYLPEAVLKIGLWDERFCGIGCQCGDYFLRALKFNKEKSSVNDAGHVRLLNPLPGNYGGKWSKGGNENVCDTPSHEACGDHGMQRWEEHNRSKLYHDICRLIFSSKYGVKMAPGKNGDPGPGHMLWEVDWSLVDMDSPPEIKDKQDVHYPYFEKPMFTGKKHPAYRLHMQ